MKYGTEQRRFVPPMPMASLRAFLPPGTLNAPSGAIIQAGIIGLAVALFLYVVLTVFRNVDPVYYWLQSDVAGVSDASVKDRRLGCLGLQT